MFWSGHLSKLCNLETCGVEMTKGSVQEALHPTLANIMQDVMTRPTLLSDNAISLIACIIYMKAISVLPDLPVPLEQSLSNDMSGNLVLNSSHSPLQLLSITSFQLQLSSKALVMCINIWVGPHAYIWELLCNFSKDSRKVSLSHGCVHSQSLKDFVANKSVLVSIDHALKQSGYARQYVDVMNVDQRHPQALCD